MEGKPKRTNSRAKRRIMVRYGLASPEKTAFTKNLSVTGMFLQTNQVFTPGSTIQVQMQLPKGDVSMWAHVAWAKTVPPALAHVLECGMGLRFLDVPVDWPTVFEEWKKKAGVIDD